MRNIQYTSLLGAAAILTACASAEVKPKELNAASEAMKTADVANMECPELVEKRNDLAEKTAKAVVKPAAVDLTSPSGIAKAKDMNAGQTAGSIAMTTVKSSIPMAGFIPLITGSAGREAKRSSALSDAKMQLARLEGVMLVKGCAISAEEEQAAEPAEQAAPAAEAAPAAQAQPAEAAPVETAQPAEAPDQQQ